MERHLLHGVTVLNLASVGPGARAGRWLADYGASVVSVTPPPGREVAISPPYHAYGAGRGLARLCVDLKDPQGREVFLRLAERADVVLESFRPGVVDRLGVGYADVAARNPRIVYCSTSGYGQHGPRARCAGHDLDYLAVSGFLACSGRGPDGKPPLPGTTVADAAAGGLHAVTAILAALLGRAGSGEGRYLDVSVADGALAMMALTVDDHLATGARTGPGASLLTGRYACYDTYPTGDGRWLAVAAIEPRFWAAFCRALGLTCWVDAQLDDAVQDRIRADVTVALAARGRDEWLAVLGEDTCVAPVLTVEEVVADEQYAARRAFVSVTHPDHGTFTQVAPLLAGTVRPDTVTARGADVTDTDALLAAAGVPAEEVRRLRERKVLA